VAETIIAHFMLRDPARFAQVTAQANTLNLKVLPREAGNSVTVVGKRNVIEGMMSKPLVSTKRKATVGSASLMATSYAMSASGHLATYQRPNVATGYGLVTLRRPNLASGYSRVALI
jgi:hypothetical protein